LPVLFNRYAEDVPSYTSPSRGLETTLEFSGEEEEEEMPRARLSRNRARAAQPHSPRYVILKLIVKGDSCVMNFDLGNVDPTSGRARVLG